MTTNRVSAREVIEEQIIGFHLDRDDHVEAVGNILNALRLAGYVILPKEPSDGMIEAGAMESWAGDRGYTHEETKMLTEENAKEIYRAMISHAEGEKG